MIARINFDWYSECILNYFSHYSVKYLVYFVYFVKFHHFVTIRKYQTTQNWIWLKIEICYSAAHTSNGATFVKHGLHLPDRQRAVHDTGDERLLLGRVISVFHHRQANMCLLL